jgi:hypothetical protein
MIRTRSAAVLLTLALTAGAASPAFAECTYPRAPASLPDGNVASMEEMVAGQQDVKQYMADMDTYLKCLEGTKAPALPAGTPADQKKEHERIEQIRVQKHNAAVGEMESVAERFNTQLRAYRARSTKKN